MADIYLYTISISDTRLDDLKQRLTLAKFPDELDEAAWDLGAPLEDIKRLTAYWRDTFDWKKAEEKLNQLPQFTTNITVEGFAPLKIHFVHKKSTVKNAIPLLFVHGWPGSYIEVTKILDSLTASNGTDTPSFHVVAISLPNFGWSEGPKQRKFALGQYAECCHNLMLKLKYDQYVTQGGDWGYYVTRAISILFPNNCRATHVNSDFGEAPDFQNYPLLALEHAISPYTAREKKGLERTHWFNTEGSSYRAQQSLKPQTLGYGLSDSPVALLAWIYEKLHDWTDAYPWTPDEICTWISIYWFSTAGPAASVRIYYEVAHTEEKAHHRVTRERTSEWVDGVKIGISHSPRDLRVLPNVWTRKQGNIVFERYHEDGGHFFAFEKPERLVKDVREMFGKKGGAYGVLKELDGYQD